MATPDAKPVLPRKPPGLAMKVTVFIVVLALCLILAELGLRLVSGKSPGRSTPLPKQLPLLSGFPQREQYVRDFQHLGPLTYHDYYDFTRAPLKTPSINFTDYFSARLCPDSAPIGQGKPAIWFFGGSTMENMETTDGLTIANQATRIVKEVGLTPASANFGTTSFQLTIESVKFQDLIRRNPPELWPDIVVFYDGFNDANGSLLFGVGNFQFDIPRKMSMMVEDDSFGLARYSVAQWLRSHSLLAQKLRLDQLIEPAKVRTPPKPDTSAANLDKAVANYLLNRRMLRAVCHELGIRPLFVLQPLVTSKAGLTAFDQEVLAKIDLDTQRFVRGFYDKVRAASAHDADFLDLSGVLDNDGRNDFFDLGHTGPTTGTTIGHALGLRLMKRRGTAKRKIGPAFPMLSSNPQPRRRQSGDWSNPLLRFKPLRWAVRRWLLARGYVTVKAGGITVRFHLRRKSDLKFLVALGGRVFEREQLEAILTRLRPTDIIYEVGGHVGTWSVFMARRLPQGHVYVFEPDQFNAQELRANVELNGLANVTHYPIAASNAAGQASFGLGGSKGDGIHSLVIGQEHKEVVQVRTLRLDAAPAELGTPAPTVLKVDCEGAEGLVVDGAAGLLERVRLMYLEIHHDRVEKTGYTPERIERMITDRGLVRVNRWDRGTETLILFERVY